MREAPQGYEFFEHTADVGMRASGTTLAELFVQCAKGWVALLAEDSRIEPSESRPVELHAASVDALLLAWLTQLIVWFDAEQFLPSEFVLTDVTEQTLRGHVQGERFDLARHTSGVEIKGVTRHEFQVARANGGWTAQLIFDV